MNEQYIRMLVPLLAQYEQELEPLVKKYPGYTLPSEYEQYRDFCAYARLAWKRLCDRARALQDELRKNA